MLVGAKMDYSQSKTYGTKAYPVNAEHTTDLLQRIEPMLTPEKLVSRYLKGIDLSQYSPEDLKDKIMLAMNNVEAMTGLILTKTQFKERVAYDRDLYRSFIFTKTNKGPVLSVERLAVVSSDGTRIFDVPAHWVEMGKAFMRQISVIPLLTVFNASGLEQGKANNAGLIFLQAINAYHWVPSFWEITYTAGVCHKDGQMPIVINELIGMEAAIEILGALQTLVTVGSQSIGQDGISQSSGLKNGGNIYQTRIEELEVKKQALMKKIKAINHQKYFLSNI
jgi:hypothetical protein